MPAEYGAPQVGVALIRRASVFASGENLGAGKIHFRRAMKYLAVTKKKDTTYVVSFFLVDLNGIEPSTSRMRTERSPS